MVKMTLGDFKRYLNKSRPNRVALRYEEQKNNNPLSTDPDFQFTFQKIDVTVCPTRIVLTGNCGSISFSGIEYVEIDKSAEAEDKLFIHCKSPLPGCCHNERVYSMRLGFA